MSQICRTCLSEITNSCFINIQQNQFVLTQLTMCIPELALDRVPDPVMCVKCAGALDAAYNFKSCCLQTEERIVALGQNTNAEINDLKLIARLCSSGNAVNSFEMCSVNANTDDNIQPQCIASAVLDSEEHKEFPRVGIGTSSLGTLQQCSNPDFENCTVKIEHNDSVPSHFEGVPNNNQMCVKEEFIKCEQSNYVTEENPPVSTSEKRVYKCSDCDYSTGKKDHLLRHSMTHTGKKPYKCDQCSFSTVQHSNYKKHVMIHTGEKPFVCNVCDYATTHKSLLNSHIMAHNGERPFKCSVCEYATTKKDSLTKHVMIHAGQRPFKCNQCNYSTVQKANLKRHLMLHTGEKPFACPMCNYATTRKSLLDSHVMAHTGERPFKCDLCEYATTRKNHLIKHGKTHAREKLLNNEKCGIESTS